MEKVHNRRRLRLTIFIAWVFGSMLLTVAAAPPGQLLIGPDLRGMPSCVVYATLQNGESLEQWRQRVQNDTDIQRCERNSKIAYETPANAAKTIELIAFIFLPPFLFIAGLAAYDRRGAKSV